MIKNKYIVYCIAVIILLGLNHACINNKSNKKNNADTGIIHRPIEDSSAIRKQENDILQKVEKENKIIHKEVQDVDSFKYWVLHRVL